MSIWEEISKEADIIEQKLKDQNQIYKKKKKDKTKQIRIPDIKKEKKRKPNKIMFPKNFLR